MSPARRLTCAETPAWLTYSAARGMTSGMSKISHCTSGRAFAKAMEYAPEPPPRSRMRRTPAVLRALTISGARSLALSCMPVMKLRVHSGVSSRLIGMRVPLRTASVSVLERCESDERVEQHACRAGIRVDPHPDLFSICPVTEGGKDVEFERCKNATARHVAADHLI